MPAREVQLDDLIGRRVRDPEDCSVGRIEEVLAEIQDGECLVREYHLGAYAVLERFAAFSIGRTILRLLPHKRTWRAYRARWDQLDLSDAERPRLRCALDDLEKLRV